MKIVDLLFPPRCICCGELLCELDRLTPYCEKCEAEWIKAKELCVLENYGQPMTVFNDAMMKDERGGTALYAVYYTSGKRGLAWNRLIFRLKESADTRSVEFAAAELAAMLQNEASFILSSGAEHDNTVVTWIPRRHSAVRRYGFDHMERVARALAKRLCLEALPLIDRRRFTMEQKYLNSKERMSNAVGAMYASEKYLLDGKTVVLVDDVITSGASVNAASSLLLSAGARRIITVCLAKSERPID